MGKKELFAIGEIAKIKGMTVKALRFYERIGLLKPYYTDPSTRYRYYSIEQFACLDIIKASRAMDISPKDLLKTMERKNMGDLAGFLAAQKKKADRKIETLQRNIRNIEEVERAIRAASESLAHCAIYTKRLPKRYVITLAFPNAADTEEAIVEFARFDRIIEESRLINTYEAGVLFRYDETAGAAPEKLFTAVRITGSSNTDGITAIPAGDYVCVCYSKSTAAEKMQLMTDYMQENALQPKLILQIELLNDIYSWDNSCFEMQILI